MDILLIDADARDSTTKRQWKSYRAVDNGHIL